MCAFQNKKGVNCAKSQDGSCPPKGEACEHPGIPSKGEERTEEDTENLLDAMGLDMDLVSEDVQEAVKSTINVLDMDFDLIDTSGEGDIDHEEFTNFFLKNLDVPENKYPNGQQKFVLRRDVCDRLFKRTAGNEEEISKNEFAAMVLQNAGFRKVTFLLMYPSVAYALNDPSSWKPVTLEQFKVYIQRNGASGDFETKCLDVFKAIAGDDDLLEFDELEAAVKKTNEAGGSLLQEAMFEDLIVASM